MNGVSGAQAINARLRFIQRQGINVAERWLKKWGNKYAVHEQRQFHKGQPGWWTGTFYRSIGCSEMQSVGNTVFVTIGPGQATENRAKFSMTGESWLIQAHALEKGAPYKAHFLSYKNNPMFELWASQHGFKTRNKQGQPSGGLVVGGRPDSILQRGIHYKASADAVVMPQIIASKTEFKADLERLADKARMTVR